MGGESKRKKNRHQRLLNENPTCCFCGGVTPSSTIDHVPPQACFPPGFFSEGFEFPACLACNSSTRKEDQIFGYYVQLADPDWKNKDLNTLLRIQNGVRNNFPNALPDTNLDINRKKEALIAMGIAPPADDILPQIPVAGLPKEFSEAATVVGRKLGCALYFKETRQFLTKDHFIWTARFHLPAPNVAPLAQYLANLLPDERIGGRSNVKDFGRRFGYKSGYKPNEDFFVCACQFGAGFAVLSITGRRDAKYNNVPPGEVHSILEPQKDANRKSHLGQL